MVSRVEKILITYGVVCGASSVVILPNIYTQMWNEMYTYCRKNIKGPLPLGIRQERELYIYTTLVILPILPAAIVLSPVLLGLKITSTYNTPPSEER